MKTFTPEQLEQMAAAYEHVYPEDYAAAGLAIAAAQARVIAGMEAWIRHLGYVAMPSDSDFTRGHVEGTNLLKRRALAELARLLTEHGLTPPKDQP